MPYGTLEHVNLTVSDIDQSANFFAKLMGWRERWRGEAMNGGETIHLGEPELGKTYLAFYTDWKMHEGQEKGHPMNHIGLSVDDVEAAEKIVISAGLEPFNHGDYEPGRRFYFLDWDGNEFEVVSYA